MFEAAELGSKVPKEEYEAQVPALRIELLDLQARLREAPFPVIIVFAGVDGAGKGETVNLLNEWMDPRWIVTRAFGQPSDEERERPEYWRFWRELPRKGRIGLFLSSWYSAPALDVVYGRISRNEFESYLNKVANFEKMLSDDQVVILKFWMHLGKKAQRKRLKTLEKDPLTRWRVTKLQWKHWRMYARFVAAAERLIERTSTGGAPWMIVEGDDERYRSLAVATTIRDAIRKALEASGSSPTLREEAPATKKAAPHLAAAAPSTAESRGRRRGTGKYTILNGLDMTQKVDRKTFRRKLEGYQGHLYQLHRKASNRGMSTILVFEGWDAAGKGGAIRRVTGALDARAYQVISIAAPSDEERAQHYLWRFWRHLSRAGRLTIFDRSWYGRVLVERVEGFASSDEWMRAYAEINQFEEQLVEHGIVLVKYWMHVTKDEQLRRFKERESSPYKSWKLTDEDWRNRKKWGDYEVAVNDMVGRTSTRAAPWTLVEANDKYFARLKVLGTACDRLENALS